MKLELIQIDKIKPNPWQPRMEFDKEKLQEMADNISKHGMIEPIVVTQRDENYVIVAGERRWRANKLAGKEKMYAIIKNYDSDVDIKRDSLIENELRENLSNNEFKTFVYSLAKSLGMPYYNKGFVNAKELARYLLGNRDSDLISKSSLYYKLVALFKIEKSAVPRLKKMVEENRINLDTAARVASIEDKDAQDKLVDMAEKATISIPQLQKEVSKRNLVEKANELRNKEPKNAPLITESKILDKIYKKSKMYTQQVIDIGDTYKAIDNQGFANKLAHSSRMDVMDSLKPLKNALERALHIVNKTMEVMSK